MAQSSSKSSKGRTARSSSGGGTGSRASGSAQSSRGGARNQGAEPFWHKALLCVPRAFGSAVRKVSVGEYDPAYRRDGLCFVMIILAVFFCGSEWFRVDGALGRGLHSFASAIFGVMSVVVPVLLIVLAIRLMRNSGKQSHNTQVIAGGVMLLWSICSIIDVVMAADTKEFSWQNIQQAGGLVGFVVGSPLAWGLSQTFAIIVFVVAAVFSVLLMTRTHVTEIPQKLSRFSRRGSADSADAQQSDPEVEQFPNEVRVGDDTLAFADGVPAHDGTDVPEPDRKGGFLARLFHRCRKGSDTDTKLDRYAGDEAFLNAASRHGAANETDLHEGPRRVSSGGAFNDDATRSIDSGTWNAQPSGTIPLPSGSMPAATATGTDPWAHLDAEGETMVVSTQTGEILDQSPTSSPMPQSAPGSGGPCHPPRRRQTMKACLTFRNSLIHHTICRI